MWACTRPLQSVHAAAELVCRGRVVVLVSYVMSTAAVGDGILDYLVLYNNSACYACVAMNSIDCCAGLLPMAMHVYVFVQTQCAWMSELVCDTRLQRINCAVSLRLLSVVSLV